MPPNVVFAASADRAVDAALMGAAVARQGGFLLVREDPTSSDVERSLETLGIRADQIVLADTDGPAGVPWPAILVSAVLCLVGVVLLVVARTRRGRRAPGTAEAPQPGAAENVSGRLGET